VQFAAFCIVCFSTSFFKETAKAPEDLRGIKRPVTNDTNGNDAPSSKIRRIQPTKIGEIQVQEKRSSNDSDNNLQDAPEGDVTEIDEKDGTEEVSQEPEAGPSSATTNEQTSELRALIKACREAEPSGDMKAVIKKKLLKYYHSVHPDYVTSKTFLKTLKTTTDEITCAPHLVFSKLNTIIEELDVRRKSKAPPAPVVAPIMSSDSVDVVETGDEVKDLHLKKLYKALVSLKRQILELEEEEVDWDDDDNSSYLKKVRFEKRACDIYKKICELTGESEHAHRTIKKPITFKGTDFPEFNKHLQKIVNRKNMFPNYREVLKNLDFCNKKYKFGLSKDQQSRVAQDAFEKLGKVLQDRRRTDLYETTTFYVGKAKDPAKEDPELRISLEKNRKNYAKYDDIINE
jgi:death-associated protein 6